MSVVRGKSKDGPKITVRVERGHLMPVSAWDFEQMMQWRTGAILEIEPVRPIQRPLERKYFAMLTVLLREADTPWTNVEAAHDAIKLATGFVTSYKKKNGAWGAHPRSITTFSDTELNEFFELFCGIVRERFGIDPETLQNESPDTGTGSSDSTLASDVDDAPGASPIPVGTGEPSPGVQNHPAPDGPGAGGGTLDFIPRDAPSSADGPKLTNEEWDWLKQAARMLVAATEPSGDTGILDRQVQAIKEFLTPPTISKDAKDKANLIYKHCRNVIRGVHPIDRPEIANVAGCKVSDLRPEAR